MSFIKTEKILEKGKSHFGCDNFEGLPLEYNGGPGTAGAHWSKKIMNTDYMIGDSYGENLISELSLALFEDSGWYKVDYELANLFIWGKDKGCDFLNFNVKCIEKKDDKIFTKFEKEFCSEFNSPTCSTSNIFRGNCKTRKYKNLHAFERYIDDNTAGVDPLTDKCPIAIEVKEGQIYYGGSCRVGQTKTLKTHEKICPECACFMSNLRKASSNEISSTNKKLRFKQVNKEEKNNNVLSNNNLDKSTPTKLRNNISSPETTPEISDSDLKAECLDYYCKDDKIMVRIFENSYECPEGGVLAVDGYEGTIECPSSDLLCNPKFKCKFGCIEKYDN